MEAWLNDLLCLDAAEHIPPPPPQLPHPSDCELYYVERDTLFSYHKVILRIILFVSCRAARHPASSPSADGFCDMLASW